MGNNFPRRTTLKDSPSLLEETLRLIEKSFHYKKPYTFKEDFAPLMDTSNHHNCFIFTDENNKVIAHIGMKDKILRVNGKDHAPSSFAGAIRKTFIKSSVSLCVVLNMNTQKKKGKEISRKRNSPHSLPRTEGPFSISSRRVFLRTISLR